MESDQRTMVQMPTIPTIVISDGTLVTQWTDHFTATEGVSLRPIEKASAVARLRALADEIEKAEAR